MQYRSLIIGTLALVGVSCTRPMEEPSKPGVSMEQPVEQEIVQEKHECKKRTSVRLNLENALERELLGKVMAPLLEQYPIAEDYRPDYNSPGLKLTLGSTPGFKSGFPFMVYIANKVGWIEVNYDAINPDRRIPESTEKIVDPINVTLKFDKCEMNSRHLRLDSVYFLYGAPWQSAVYVPLEKLRYTEQRLDEPSPK